MAGKSAFRQPIRMGKDTGVPATTSLGNALISQIAGVSAGLGTATQIARTPADTEGGAITSDLHSFVVDLVTAQSEVSGGGDVSLEIGLSGDATYFGRIKVSARGRYTITPSNASAGGVDKWYGLTAVPIFAKISAAGSGAAADATGFISTIYVPR